MPFPPSRQTKRAAKGGIKEGVMKKGTWLSGLFLKYIVNGAGLGLSLFLLMSRSYDVSFVLDSFATPVQDTAAISGSCSDSPVTAFAMDGDYTITWAAPSASAGPSCSASLAMPGGQVNGDSVPSVTCLIGMGAQTGFVILRNRQPSMKLGGLACSTEDRSTLEVHGDGSDNTSFDIALNTVSANGWDASKKVDDATSVGRYR